MNTIVIWSIIKRWYNKPIGKCLIKLFFSVIALVGTIYIYIICNSVQTQDILLWTKTDGNVVVRGSRIHLVLDYDDYSSNLVVPNSNDTISGNALICDYFLEKKEDKCNPVFISGNSTMFYTDLSVSSFNRLRDSISSYIRYVEYSFNIYCMFDLKKDWTLLRRPQSRHCEIVDSRFIRNGYDFSFVEELSPKSEMVQISRKKDIQEGKDIYMLGLCSGGSWDNDQTVEVVQMKKTATSHEIYAPHWYSMHDVTKLYVNIYAVVDSLIYLGLDVPGRGIIDDVYPIPDYREQHLIAFDKNKSDEINGDSKGVKMHVSFPHLQYIQDTRNTILSFLITLFLTIIATLLFNIGRIGIRLRQRLVYQLNHYACCDRNKVIKYVMILLCCDTVFVVILSVIVLYYTYFQSDYLVFTVALCIIFPIIRYMLRGIMLCKHKQGAVIFYKAIGSSVKYSLCLLTGTVVVLMWWYLGNITNMDLILKLAYPICIVVTLGYLSKIYKFNSVIKSKIRE